MRPLLPAFCALVLALTACGESDTTLASVQDPGERERIQAWMTGFDQEFTNVVKTYGIGAWMIPGDKVDSTDMALQNLTTISCENLSTITSAQPQTSGGYMAQVRGLWLYVMGGCAGSDPQAQSQALGVLETARRRMGQQWEQELTALPGSVRIEVKAGTRAKRIEAALLLGSNEHISCLGGAVANNKADGRDMTFQEARDRCGTYSKDMMRYGACPVAWQVISSHQMADQMKTTRDDHAWVADATARFRMGWRGCNPQSLGQWQAYAPHIPAHLREGRLKRISAPADPLMACQVFHFTRMLNKYGAMDMAQHDETIMSWCGNQMGLSQLSIRMAPPRVFTMEILNDSGNSVSWLYDPAKATARPQEWRMSTCMTQVAHKLASEGINIPDPTVLNDYCNVNNGQQARDYLSGQALVDGRARAGNPPE